MTPAPFVTVNTGFVHKLVFLAALAFLGVLWWRGKAADDHHHREGGDAPVAE